MNECDYCLKESYHHDGKCAREKQFSSKPCLLYEKDPRGKPMYSNKIKFRVKFGVDIPELNKPDNDWLLDNVDKTLTLTRIHKIEWDTNAKGLHGIILIADLWYWSDENGKLPPSKPKLKLVRRE